MTNILIIGAGGHAKVLVDSLRHYTNIKLIGLIDINRDRINQKILNFSIIGDENDIFEKYSPSQIKLINGIGSIGLSSVRKQIFDKFKRANYEFFTIINPYTYIGQEVMIHEGTQIMAGCVIQPGTKIGKNVIINTGSKIDHDCFIEDHVHIAPGVTCCGNVYIGHGSHIGCGATILQGVSIGENCLIAAGALVVRDVKNNEKVAGIPAKIME